MASPLIDYPFHLPLLVIDKQAYLSLPSIPFPIYNRFKRVSQCLTLIVTLFNNKKAIIQIV